MVIHGFQAIEISRESLKRDAPELATQVFYLRACYELIFVGITLKTYNL
jgi:hypothetical protein